MKACNLSNTHRKTMKIVTAISKKRYTIKQGVDLRFFISFARHKTANETKLRQKQYLGEIKTLKTWTFQIGLQ